MTADADLREWLENIGHAVEQGHTAIYQYTATPERVAALARVALAAVSACEHSGSFDEVQLTVTTPVGCMDQLQSGIDALAETIKEG